MSSEERKAPVIVFLHGWLATNPAVYGAWIEHLVRRGSIVIFPRYHQDWLTSPTTYLPNTVAAIHDALDVLQTGPGRVRPDLDKFALVGHSAGANLAAQVAAVAKQAGLPHPCALLAFLPGEVRPVPGPDLRQIPADTLLVVAAAEQDVVVGDSRARSIFREAAQIPEDRKLYVLYRSDLSGYPPLLADHFVPCAEQPALDNGEGPFRLLQLEQARVDRLDLLGIWRLTDLVLAAGFQHAGLDDLERLEFAISDLGRWPDGRPVRPPLISHRVEGIPRVVPSYGLRLFPWTFPEPVVPPLFTDFPVLGGDSLPLGSTAPVPHTRTPGGRPAPLSGAESQDSGRGSTGTWKSDLKTSSVRPPVPDLTVPDRNRMASGSSLGLLMRRTPVPVVDQS